MQRVPAWKIALIAIILLISFWKLYPSMKYYMIDPVARQNDQYKDLAKKAIKLGLDLQGGVHLVIEVDVEAYKKQLASEGMAQDQIAEREKTVLDQAAAVIENRVDAYGVAEASIFKQPPSRIVLEMPGFSNPQDVENLVQANAMLSFHLVPERGIIGDVISDIDSATQGQFQPLLSQATGMSAVIVDIDNVAKVDEIIKRKDTAQYIPKDYMFKWGPKEVPGTDRYGKEHKMLYLIEVKSEVTGAHLKEARLSYGGNRAQPVVYINFDSVGKNAFSRVTGLNIGKPLAILLDNTVYSAPTIQDKIANGSASITGINNMQEAKQIEVVLNAGALPAPLKVEESRVVGPSLGRDSIHQSLVAGITGSAAVLIFMFVYYSISGAIADIAVVLNIFLLLAGMAMLRSTLTLPGIAGVILTVGMAVDYNILIFERLREEMHAKRVQGVSLIMDKGYTRAFMTIFDSNTTTLLTSLVLFQFGTGPLKGFAVSLSLGVLISMFTAVFVSRVMQDLLHAYWMPDLRVGVIRFFHGTKIDFFKHPVIVSTVTATFGLLGTLYLSVMWYNGSIQGIDFAGGTEIFAKFDGNVNAQEIRDKLSSAGVANAQIQEILDVKNQFLIRIPLDQKMTGNSVTFLEGKIKQALPDKSFTTVGSNAVGAKVGNELLWKGLNCLFFSCLGIGLYIAARFEFRFGIGAVVGLLHDLLFIFAYIAFTHTAVNLPVVAALLTILGYSTHDTIVVFDRIRENYKTSTMNFRDMINDSINQTLSRTIITSMTVLFTILALYVFGGPVLHDFAAILFIGIIVGTYSSICIASPVLLWMSKEEKKATGTPKGKRKDVKAAEAAV